MLSMVSYYCENIRKSGDSNNFSTVIVTWQDSDCQGIKWLTHGNQLSLKENKQYVILSVSEGTLSQNRHKCKDSSSLCSSE